MTTENPGEKTTVTSATTSATTETAERAAEDNREHLDDAPERRRTRLVGGVLALVGLIAAIIFRASLLAWFTGSPLHQSATPTSASVDVSADVDHYTCTMHPSIHAAHPGKCPICGMELVAVTRAQLASGVVTVDETRRRLIGVRTAPVLEAPMHTSLRAAGRVAYDESKLVDVTWRASGFVTRLHAGETGRRVQKGETLAVVYSPDIYAAERDFLLSQKGPAAGLVDASGARTRLRLLGLSDAQIDGIAAQGAPGEGIAVTAPTSGTLIEKNIVEGAAFEAGARLFRIGSLDAVWIEADVYQADLARVAVGDVATVVIDAATDQRVQATVSTVFPSVDESARVGRVRLRLPNRGDALKPGMFVTVELRRELGTRLQIPVGAVVYTGPRRLVFVDLGDGQLKPTEVHVGVEADGMLEVTDGLRAGDVVATSGVFLLAAEARIATAATFWDKSAPSTLDVQPAGSPTVQSPTAPAPRGAHARTPPVPHRDPPALPPSSLPSTSTNAPADTADHYWCPMHHDVRRKTPGTCPRCGMTLVPIPVDVPVDAQKGGMP